MLRIALFTDAVNSLPPVSDIIYICHIYMAKFSFFDQRNCDRNMISAVYRDITTVFSTLVSSYEPLFRLLQDVEYPNAKQLPLKLEGEKDPVIIKWFQDNSSERTGAVALVIEEFFKYFSRHDPYYYVLALYDDKTYVGHIFYSLKSISSPECLVFQSIFKNIKASITGFAEKIIEKLETLARENNKTCMYVIGPYPHMKVILSNRGFINNNYGNMIKTLAPVGGSRKKFLDACTIPELKARAVECGVSLAGCKRKNEMVAKLHGSSSRKFIF